MKTLLLNPQTWDLLVTTGRNIAVASEPYALAQDAGSAVKLFQGEDYYDTSRGVPYWQQILGKWPQPRIIKSYLDRAALTVPGVVDARCFIESIEDRRPKGQVQVTDQTGLFAAIGF